MSEQTNEPGDSAVSVCPCFTVLASNSCHVVDLGAGANENVPIMEILVPGNNIIILSKFLR